MHHQLSSSRKQLIAERARVMRRLPCLRIASSGIEWYSESELVSQLTISHRSAFNMPDGFNMRVSTGPDPGRGIFERVLRHKGATRAAGSWIFASILVIACGGKTTDHSGIGGSSNVGGASFGGGGQINTGGTQGIATGGTTRTGGTAATGGVGIGGVGDGGTGATAGSSSASSGGARPGIDAACIYGVTYYRLGETFPAVDGCNTCACSSTGVNCTTLDCPCKPEVEWWHEYVSKDVAQCMTLEIACKTHTVSFVNACGCGCEESKTCPYVWDCSTWHVNCPAGADDKSFCPFASVWD
jgi:hypothetical protein